MAAAEWTLFVGVVAIVTAAVLVLAHRSAGPVADGSLAGLSRGALLLNVAISQALVGAVLACAAWYAGVPPDVLGLGPDALAGTTLALGVAAGVALYAADEGVAAGLRGVGVDVPETLRDLLAPESRREWALLLCVLLPVVAGVEEVLFRAALVGGVGAATGFPPWILVVASSALFGLAHGAQGAPGVAVAGVLGVALGALFVATGSLPAAVLAHYTVNALEFLVHERGGTGRAGAD
jgi:membrane protease YdiL (CAAX protease family)